MSLRTLCLGDRGIAALLPLLACGQALKCLCLAGNGIRETGIKQLLTTTPDGKLTLPELAVLDLSDNPLASPCAEAMLNYLASKPRLILLGIAGTQMTSTSRQRVLRRVLASFTAASPEQMLEALRLAADTSIFLDREIWTRTQPIAETNGSFFVREAPDEIVSETQVLTSPAAEAAAACRLRLLPSAEVTRQLWRPSHGQLHCRVRPWHRQQTASQAAPA